MNSKISAAKALKGNVQVISSNNRLQLRFSFAGKRHYLSMGLPDTIVNRKAAEAKARQIELDILSGNFDPTLAKYKHHTYWARELSRFYCTTDGSSDDANSN
ncbi:phage integrase family protein [Calothrix sp. NIES-2100]|uniref:Arm DNA-binding domain-containing protein n=1 Tax=Calothrix sp. NIES-2100 TaxID=1954172 RepID=UPI000B5E5799|nr:phage integrase family protein [Calothrix sp. NIES-2100]